MASSHQRAYYILQPITETNGSEQPNYILKCLKFMLRLYSNFAFHQQMAILSYSISFTKEFIVFIDTVKSQFPSPSLPQLYFFYIVFKHVCHLPLLPCSSFTVQEFGVCTHSPSLYFLSPSSCRSSLGFGGSLNIFGLDTLTGHYDSTYPEQLLT